MTDRIYASLFYIAFILVSSWVAISAGETLARATLSKLALIPSHVTRPSRVDTVLATLERGPESTATREPLIPSAPSVTVEALAKAMDEAELAHPAPVVEENVAGDAKRDVAIPESPKPRVAGWSKRLPRRTLALPEETASHIIMRSLRAGM